MKASPHTPSPPLGGLLLGALLALVPVRHSGAVPSGRPEPSYTATREVLVHFRIEKRGAAAIEEFTLFYTTDGGQIWHRDARTSSPLAPFVFTAPTDGRYGFTVIARDAAGRGEPEPSPGTRPLREIVVDTRPPSVRIIRPAPDSHISTSLPLEVHWRVEDRFLGSRPVEVSYSLDDGPWVRVWQDAPATDRRRWAVPFSRGQLRLRVRAWDRAGNLAEAVTDPPLRLFEPTTSAAGPLIVPSRSRRLDVPVHYRLCDSDGSPIPPGGLVEVRLWYRKDSGEWQDGGLDLDRRSPATLRVPGDGLYEVYVTARPRGPVGTSPLVGPPFHASPPAEAEPLGTVLVDTLEPRVKILEPPPGAVIAPDSPLTVRFAIEEENPLEEAPELMVSLDRGRSWTDLSATPSLRRLPDGLRTLGEVGFRLPSLDPAAILFRVEQRDLVGNVGSTRTDPENPVRVRPGSENLREKAEQAYRDALLLFSQPDPIGKRESLTRFREALRLWEPIAALHHDYAVALEWTATDDGAPPPAILEHYRRAVELDPENPHIRFNLIRHLLRLSQEEVRDPARRQALRDEAEAAFGLIDWPALLADGDARGTPEDRAALREQYLRWKTTEFEERP